MKYIFCIMEFSGFEILKTGIILLECRLWPLGAWNCQNYEYKYTPVGFWFQSLLPKEVNSL